MTLLLLVYSWKTDTSTLYWYMFFGSAIIVSALVFYGVTSKGFEEWRQRVEARYDRSRLAEHMRRAGTAFHSQKKNTGRGE